MAWRGRWIALHPSDVADNLAARRVQTQTRSLTRIGSGTCLIAGLAFILMTFPKARQLGTSLLASAGVAGLIIGIAARSVFSNLLAGLQIALAQPIRIDDVLIVEGEWGVSKKSAQPHRARISTCAVSCGRA